MVNRERLLQKLIDILRDVDPVVGSVISSRRSDAWDSGNYLTQFYEVEYECGLCGGRGVVSVEQAIKEYGCPLECDFECDNCPILDCEITCPSCRGEGRVFRTW